MASAKRQARIEREKAAARNEKRMRGRYQNSRPRVTSGMEAVRDSSFPTMRPSTQHQIFKIIEKGAKGVNVAGTALLASGLIDPDRTEGRNSDRAAAEWTLRQKNSSPEAKANARKSIKAANTPPPRPVNPMAKYGDRPESQAIKKKMKVSR